MSNKKVSIIVPVYNVEKFLSKCIESILVQSYQDIELIIVNDGSPDRSQEIIDKYKKLDKRIVAAYQDNKGVSTARNVGLGLAKGEYVMFIDSDDYVDVDYVMKFVDLIERRKADIAVSYNMYDEDNVLPEGSEKVWFIGGDAAAIDLYLGKFGVAVWNKIYRRDFLVKNNLVFDTNFWYAEGMTFNIECFMMAKKIAAGDIKVYHQVKNPQSAVRSFKLKNQYCGMQAMMKQRECLICKMRI